MSIKKKLSLKNIILALIISTVFLIVVFVVLMFGWIFIEVKSTCSIAQAEYKMSCVDSLIKVLQSDEKSFKQRNSAIWALGQLADKKSLPALKSFYTGNIPAREPLDKTISQYEIRKAIRWCEEGNWTSWMYGIID